MESYPSGQLACWNPAQARAVSILDAIAEDRIELLSGRYRVVLNGAMLWAPGP
jgi:hypothetical protein